MFHVLFPLIATRPFKTTYPMYQYLLECTLIHRIQSWSLLRQLPLRNHVLQRGQMRQLELAKRTSDCILKIEVVVEDELESILRRCGFITSASIMVAYTC